MYQLVRRRRGEVAYAPLPGTYSSELAAKDALVILSDPRFDLVIVRVSEVFS